MTQFYSKSKANAVDYTNMHSRNLGPIKLKITIILVFFNIS